MLNQEWQVSTSKRVSRRRFVQGLGYVAAVAATARKAVAFTANDPEAVLRVAVKNRAPLRPNAFYLLPLGSIKPAGWLKRQMRIQADGLSGHLGETWADVGPNSGWLGGTGESWERGPYYIDGLLPLAFALDDPALKAKAQQFVEWTLTHQASNGMLGPSSNDDWWPRIVLLKALTQYQELTDDPRVIPAMQRYLKLQLSELPQRPLRDWGKFRWQDEVLSVLWLYNRTGESWLLDLAALLRKQGFDWIGNYADFRYREKMTPEFIKLKENNGLGDTALATHGVNNGQGLKTGAIWSVVSGSNSDRANVRRALEVLDQFHGLPNGMFSCDEHLAGRNPSQGSELCTVVETMFSLEHSLAITGDAALGDRLERLAFNALPGTFDDAMWAHQYNQEPNQVECSLHHKPWVSDGPESNLYGLEPNFGCCTANYHQGWPKFTNSLWMASVDDGIAAAAYAPCEVRTAVKGTPVHLAVDTEYPFRGTVKITVRPSTTVSFPISLRIPAWADGTSLRVNGVAQPVPQAGTFARVERTWKPGDVVEIAFPMKPRVSRWFNNSVAVERGPLVFSYGIGESWVKLRDRGMAADWQVFPATGWNYALDSSDLRVSEASIPDMPFSRKSPSVRIAAKARKLDAWRAEDGVANAVPQSPVTSAAKDEEVELIPYGAAKLRITAFPELKKA
jgi:hypothetical protein